MNLFRSTRDGMKALRDRKARNAEIDAELESFLSESISDKMRSGMSLKEAERAARVEVGSASVVKHKVWNAGWESHADRLWSDLMYTLRRLSHSRALVLTVVLSIGLGIAANATIFSLVSKFVLQQPPVGDPATMVTVNRTYDHGQCCNNFPVPVVRDVQQQAKSFSGVAGYYETMQTSLGLSGDPHREWGQAVTANFFDVAQMTMAAGRGFAANEESAPVIVLGYNLWQQRFRGDPGIVGKVIDVSGYPYTVAGVAPRGFRGLDQVLNPQFWVPLGKLPELAVNAPPQTSRESQWLRIAARLRPGVSRAEASRELSVIADRLAQQYPKTDKGNGFMVEGIGSMPGRIGTALHLFLLGLSLVALLVLCIACANVANILLAQGAQRQREMAVRLALGSTRGQLMRQMLVESLLLALGGGIVGVLLSVWATYALSSFRLPVPIAMDLSVRVDARVLAYSFGLSFLAGFLCGMVPAWQASRVVVSPALKGEDALSRPGRRFSLRNVLVIVQMTLSLVLLCAAGLFLRSMQHALKIDAGFRSSGMVMMSINPPLQRYTPQSTALLLDNLRERVASLPGVVSATVTDGVPLSMGHRSDSVDVPGMPKPDGANNVELYMVAPDYLTTMGIPLLAGRTVGEENPNAPRVGVVNQEFVRRYFRGANPIGHIVNDGSVSYTIIGVARDIKSRTIGEDQRPVMFRPINQNIASDQWQDGYTVIARYQGDAATLSKAMQDAIRGVDASLAIYNVQTMEEHMHEALFLPRLVNSIFLVFGITGVSLAAIGLYGVMSYMVSHRTKEIGIRMALGARMGQVQGMLLEGGMRLAVISIVVGVPLALAAARLTGALLYGIKPWDVATFTAVPLLLFAVALAACWMPSRRAARVDPMIALRID